MISHINIFLVLVELIVMMTIALCSMNVGWPRFLWIINDVLQVLLPMYVCIVRMERILLIALSMMHEVLYVWVR